MICKLCPRACGALRTETEGHGVCRMPALPVVARAALHMWEEPPISGTRGAGTVFFSGCSLGCVFCQNESISHRDFGKPVTVSRLREIFFALIDQGAHNIDLVNPTHYAHVVDQALAEPLPVPVVWNSGGYDKVETLRALEGKVQIYLPDLKYVSPALGEKYSGAADYFDCGSRAVLEMYRQTGPYELGEDGLLRRGVVIRHLVLPGQLADTKRIIDWAARTFRPGQVLFSLMSQYTPVPGAPPELARRLYRSEYRAACAYLENCGIGEGFLQERTAAKEEYTPPFDLTGV